MLKLHLDLSQNLTFLINLISDSISQNLTCLELEHELDLRLKTSFISTAPGIRGQDGLGIFVDMKGSG